MAQLTWTYVGDNGKHYNVGLFHGPNTGHLMVHCNQQVVLIDFNVLESKSYPLFIDDELFELIIDNTKGQFSYGFEINKKADTPRNRFRKKIEKKHWRQTLVFFGILLAIGTVFCGFVLFYNSSQKDKNLAPLLETQGVETVARVDKIGGSSSGPQLQISFVADTHAKQGKHLLIGSSEAYTPEGFSIHEGDEFIIKYLPQDPSVFELQIQQPSNRQLETYREKAMEKHMELHPEVTAPTARCLLEIAYELKGLGGIADFYNQDQSSSENEVSNELTYKRLIRDVPFKQESSKRCSY